MTEIARWSRKCFNPLSLSAPTSTCIFSTLFFIHSPWYCLREFVLTSQHFIFGDHFINSHDLSVWSGSVNIERNWMWSPLGLKGFTRQASHVTIHYYGLTTVAVVEEVFTHCDSLGSWHIYLPLYRGVSLANGHKFMMGNDEIYPLILKASVFSFFSENANWSRYIVWKSGMQRFTRFVPLTARPDLIA